jgi:flagellar hook-basal body complex protein FliE
MNISSITGRTVSGSDALTSQPTGVGAAGGASFGDTLAKAVDAVNTLQWEAQGGARSLADGTAANLHDVTIALEQANIALQLTATVRNKVIEAYQEIMRLQV